MARHDAARSALVHQRVLYENWAAADAAVPTVSTMLPLWRQLLA